MAASIRNTYVRDTYIGSNCAMNTWIWCTTIGNAYTRNIYISGAYIRDIKPKILARSELILRSPGIIFIYTSINNYCL